MTPTATSATSQPGADLTALISSATKLTPLQLNNIRLDIRHTILTPDYLDKLAEEKPEPTASNATF